MKIAIPKMVHYRIPIVDNIPEPLNLPDPPRSLELTNPPSQPNLSLLEHKPQVVPIRNIRNLLVHWDILKIVKPHFLQQRLQDILVSASNRRPVELDDVPACRGDAQGVDSFGLGLGSLVVVLVGDRYQVLLPRKHIFYIFYAIHSQPARSPNQSVRDLKPVPFLLAMINIIKTRRWTPDPTTTITADLDPITPPSTIYSTQPLQRIVQPHPTITKKQSLQPLTIP